MRMDRIFEIMRSNSPTPRNECPQFDAFRDRFSLITLFLNIFISYLSSVLIIVPTETHSSSISFVANRMDFLREQDMNSLRVFLATLYSGFVLLPFVIILWGVGYWKTVIRLGKAKPVNSDTIVVMIFQITVAVAAFYIAFLSVPGVYDARWPGRARILFWPIFPAIGAMVFWLATILLFSAIVGALKFVFIPEGQNGRR
jgi:hypothetical protein